MFQTLLFESLLVQLEVVLRNELLFEVSSSLNAFCGREEEQSWNDALYAVKNVFA